jgi:tetratricopeptide (TPR) repeat protein
VRKYTPNQVNVNRYLDIAGKYFFGLGNKCKAENKIDSAIYAFKYGSIAAPNVGEMWFNLGNCYFAAGKYREALQPLEKAKQLMANKPEVAQFYEQVKAMVK